MTSANGIDPSVPPSGSGCVECDAAGGWWFHLRRCAQCGHIGCCDDSPAKHASAHYRDTGHPVEPFQRAQQRRLPVPAGCRDAELDRSARIGGDPVQDVPGRAVQDGYRSGHRVAHRRYAPAG